MFINPILFFRVHTEKKILKLKFQVLLKVSCLNITDIVVFLQKFCNGKFSFIVHILERMINNKCSQSKSKWVNHIVWAVETYFLPEITNNDNTVARNLELFRVFFVYLLVCFLAVHYRHPIMVSNTVKVKIKKNRYNNQTQHFCILSPDSVKQVQRSS